MPVTTIETFDAVDIKMQGAFQRRAVTEPFGCVGSLDAVNRN
ncbi:hypothetical protein ACT7DB_07760 [Bacillus cereus]